MSGETKALEALAQAYDREDASQRGEPSPWDDGAEDATWRAERLACAKAGRDAYLAATAREEGPREIALGEDEMPERIWAGDFDAQGFGHCVAGMQGGLYAEYVRADLSKVVKAQPVAFVDAKGNLLIPDGSPLPEMLGMLGDDPFGEVQPLFATPQPSPDTDGDAA